MNAPTSNPPPLTDYQYSVFAEAWRKGYKAGIGFEPHDDKIGEPISVEAAVKAAVACGCVVVWTPANSSEIAIVRDAHGQYVGIGVDGPSSWAVQLETALDNLLARPSKELAALRWKPII